MTSLVYFLLIILGIAALVFCSAIFNGLTMAFVSVDEQTLRDIELYQTSSTKKYYIKKIRQIIKEKYRFLLTMILLNTICAESIPILFNLLYQSPYAILFSVILIVIFSEIIPSVICIRYDIWITGFFVWPVKICMFLLCPINYPVGYFLKCILGNKKHAKFVLKVEEENLFAMNSESEEDDMKLQLDKLPVEN